MHICKEPNLVAIAIVSYFPLHPLQRTVAPTRLQNTLHGSRGACGSRCAVVQLVLHKGIHGLPPLPERS